MRRPSRNSCGASIDFHHDFMEGAWAMIDDRVDPLARSAQAEPLAKGGLGNTIMQQFEREVLAPISGQYHRAGDHNIGWVV
jgi:hypothetical protein